jgi:hypothetical protein
MGKVGMGDASEEEEGMEEEMGRKYTEGAREAGAKKVEEGSKPGKPW